MRKNIVLILAFVLFVFMFGTSEAQPPMGRGPKGPPSTGEVLQTQPFLSPGEKGEPIPPNFPTEPIIPPPDVDMPAHEVLEQIMLARIAKQLNLNDEQTVLLVRKFNEQRELLEKKNKQRNEIANDIKKLLQGESDENAKELEEKLNLLVKTDIEIAELKYKWMDNLTMDLPLNSKVQLYLFFSDFENEIRKFLRKTYEWKQNRFPENKMRLQADEQQRRKRVMQKPADTPDNDGTSE